MARKKSIATRKLTKRQMVLAEKDNNKGKASNSHPMQQHTRRLAQMTSEIPPCGSSHAISRPTDPFARTSDVIPPPSIQGIHSSHTSQPTNPDAGHTLNMVPKKSSAIHRKFVRQQGHPTKQCTTRPVQMTSQIPPCASSHAISGPTDPFARTSDVRDPPSIRGVHSPRTSQPTNLDAGHTLRSFVALETQNNDGKPIIYLGGQGFLPSRPVANEIGDILKSHYTDPWPSWKKIPISTRDLWFGEFLRKFSICPPDYDWAKKNFEIQGAAMMKKILNEARTTMNKPNWVKDDVWERLCEHWKSEELKKSTQAETNQNKETGILPTPLELFCCKHQRKDNTWVDIQEEFTRTLEQLTKSAFEQGNPPPSQSDVWHVVRKKKGKMYGLGMAGRSCYHGSSSSMEWVKRQEFNELRKKMKEIRNERDELQSRVANIERLAEHNNALIQELMGSMNMPSTIDGSQDEDTSLKQVPFSIVRSKNIGYVSFCGYEGLARDVFPTLIWSWMSPTSGLVSCIQSVGRMSTSIVSVDIQDKNLSNLLSKLSEFSKLQSISVQCDSDFQLTQELRIIMDDLCNANFAELETTYASHISEKSMVSRLIGMGSCNRVIDMLSKSISEGLTTHVSSDLLLPGDNYPYWLSYIGEGYSVHFQVADDSDCRMKGMVLCVVYSSTPENKATESLTSVLIFNYTQCIIQIYKQTTAMSFTDEDWQGVISNLGPGDNVEIFVTFGHGMMVKKTAVYLIYDQPITMRMESSPEVRAHSSPDVEMEASLNVQLETSKKPKKNIFAKIKKKMSVCLCLN